MKAVDLCSDFMRERICDFMEYFAEKDFSIIVCEFNRKGRDINESEKRNKTAVFNMRTPSVYGKRP